MTELVQYIYLQGDNAIGVIAVALAALLLALARFLEAKQDRERTKIGGVYLMLAIIAGITFWIAPPQSKIENTSRFFYWLFLLASCGRSFVLLGVDVFFGRRTQTAPPKIFRDLTQAVVYVFVLMLTLHANGVEPGSLLTTSALLTAVVGLSLQDTLGNLVSGLALQMQRPFVVGDWIQFEQDPRQIGQVTEVNWRATTVMTSDLIEVIVPNAMLAKAPIRNYSRPSKISRRTVAVQGSYESPPHEVQKTIEKAIHGTPGVMSDPPPWVQTKVFADSGIEYTVWFYTDDFASRERTDGLVRDRIWYAMNRAKLSIPFPIRTIYTHDTSEETAARLHERELERRDKMLSCVDFLDVLPPNTHRKLASVGDVRLFAPGEAIIEQGDTGNDLFIIDSGEVAVEVGRENKRFSVAKLGPGKFFGEMGFMIGEARTATVRAITPCTLFIIGHDAFHDTIATEPDVVEKISDLLAARQAELEALESERRPTIEPMQDRSKRLISQIKSFFKL